MPDTEMKWVAFSWHEDGGVALIGVYTHGRDAATDARQEAVALNGDREDGIVTDPEGSISPAPYDYRDSAFMVLSHTADPLQRSWATWIHEVPIGSAWG